MEISPTMLLIIGGILLFLFLQGDGGNPLLQRLIGIIKGLFNVPEQSMQEHVCDKEECRIACTLHLAQWLTKKGRHESAAKLRETLQDFLD